MSEVEKLCRLCRGTSGTFISPCKCEGSMGYTHPNCLAEWICRKKSIRCEICQENYYLCKEEVVSPRLLSAEGIFLVAKGISNFLLKHVEAVLSLMINFMTSALIGLLYCIAYREKASPFEALLNLQNYASTPVEALYFFLLGNAILYGHKVVLLPLYEQFEKWTVIHPTEMPYLPYVAPAVPVLSLYEMEEEEEEDGAAQFLLQVKEKEKRLVNISHSEKQEILDHLARTLEKQRKINRMANARAAARISCYVISLNASLLLFYSGIPKLLLWSAFSFAFLARFIQGSISDTVLQIFSAAFITNSQLILGALSALTVSIVCNALLSAMSRYPRCRGFAVFLCYVKGIFVTSWILVGFCVILGLLIAVFNWEHIFVDSVGEFDVAKAWGYLVSESVIPIDCSKNANYTSLSNGIGIKSIALVIKEGRHFLENQQSLNAFDPISCASMMPKSSRFQYYLFSAALISRIDVVSCASVSRGFFFSLLIIWIHYYHSKLFWLPKFSLEKDHFFQHLSKQWISMSDFVLNGLKFIFVTVVLDRTLGELSFRVASLMAPGNLQVDVDYFGFDFLPLTISFMFLNVSYCVTSKDLHGAIQSFLRTALGLFENIEGNLSGSTAAKVVYHGFYTIITTCFAIGSIVRLFVYTRAPHDVDLPFFVAVCVFRSYFSGMLSCAVKYVCVAVKSRFWLLMYHLMLYEKFDIAEIVVSEMSGVWVLKCRSSGEGSTTQSVKILQAEVENMFHKTYRSAYTIVSHLCTVLFFIVTPFFFPLQQLPNLRINFICFTLSPLFEDGVLYTFNLFFLFGLLQFELIISSWTKKQLIPTNFLFCLNRKSVLDVIFFLWSRFLFVESFLSLRNAHFSMIDTLIHLILFCISIVIIRNLLKKNGAVLRKRKNNIFLVERQNNQAKNYAAHVSAQVNRSAAQINRLITLFCRKLHNALLSLRDSEVNPSVYFSNKKR